jgi:hypothetical protein
MRFSSFPLLAGFFLGVAVALAGCGFGQSVGQCAPVKGKITLGGKPLIGGRVMFIPLETEANAPRPEAEINAQGLYSLKTDGREGAPPGKYRAVVTTSGLDKTQDTQFNSVYSSWEKSPLVRQVTENAAAGAYDLKLDPR